MLQITTNPKCHQTCLWQARNAGLAQATASLSTPSERELSFCLIITFLPAQPPGSKSNCGDTSAAYNEEHLPLQGKQAPTSQKSWSTGKAATQAKGFQELHTPRLLQGKLLKMDHSCTHPSLPLHRQIDRQTEGCPKHWFPTMLGFMPPPGVRHIH